jgi:predicted DNA-binding protein
MTEYKMIAVETKLHDSISKLAKETHRTNGGMVREMFEWYIRSIPVTGKVEDGRVVWGSDTGSE